MNKLTVIDTTRVLETTIFSVEKTTFIPPGEKPDLHITHYRIQCSDWVNILPITHMGCAVLIRQPRVGTESVILETPGGVINPSEKDITLAAARELEEETGLTTSRLIPMAALNPNPAIMTNRCHFFLALGCEPASLRKHFADPHEFITTETVAVEQLDKMLRIGEIDNGISALCILLAMRYIGR